MSAGEPVIRPRERVPWLSGIAVATACGVFPLIFVGAGVTSTDSGMAFPDWPTSGGRMVNPPGWLGQWDTAWEHGHRLIGWIVGMLALVLAGGGVWRGGRVRWLALATLAAIAIQGVLGGVRVTLVSTKLAMLHGIWGQVCFCLACTTAVCSSSRWGPSRGTLEVRAAVFLQRLCLAGTIAVFVQLVLGAAQRHFGSPPTLVAHVLWAVVVLFLLGWIAMWLADGGGGGRLLAGLGKTVGVLTLGQLVLGSGAYLVTVLRAAGGGALSWLVPSAHVAAGALLLAAMVVLTLCAYHMVRPLTAVRNRPGLALAAA